MDNTDSSLLTRLYCFQNIVVCLHGQKGIRNESLGQQTNLKRSMQAREHDLSVRKLTFRISSLVLSV